MIMHDIIELAAQVGGMHSKNPVVNYVYKIRKKRMLKEILERVDRLPEAPRVEDIYYFSSLVERCFGLDVDGDVKHFKLSDGSTASIFVANGIYRELSYRIINGSMEYKIDVDGNHMNISKISHSRGYDIGTTADPVIFYRLGEIIKLGLKEICTNMVLGR